MKRNHIIYILSIIGLAALIIMLIFTSPTDIGPFGVLLFFTTIYVVVLGIVTFFVQSFRRIALKKPLEKNKDYLYCAVLAFGPIMFLMAGSFGAIDILVSCLIIAFLALAEFLVYKRV